MANYKAFVVVALALGAFLAVPRAGAEGTEEDYDQNKATDSGGCDNQDSSGSDCPCKEDEQTDPGNGCVQISVDMGRTRYSPPPRSGCGPGRASPAPSMAPPRTTPRSWPGPGATSRNG